MDPDPSIMFRRGRNVRDRLTNSHFVPPQPIGNWLSRQPKSNFKCIGCIACLFIRTGASFASNITNRTFNNHHFINCRSNKLIYLISCTCGAQYFSKEAWTQKSMPTAFICSVFSFGSHDNAECGQHGNAYFRLDHMTCTRHARCNDIARSPPIGGASPRLLVSTRSHTLQHKRSGHHRSISRSTWETLDGLGVGRSVPYVRYW